MIFEIVCPIQIDPLPTRIGFDDHIPSSSDPAISRLRVMHWMYSIHEVYLVFWGFFPLEISVFFEKLLLCFTIRFTRNMFGLLVGKPELVQKAGHALGRISNPESLLDKSTDFLCRKIHVTFKVFNQFCLLAFGQFTCTASVIVLHQSINTSRSI